MRPRIAKMVDAIVIGALASQLFGSNSWKGFTAIMLWAVASNLAESIDKGRVKNEKR